MIHIRYKDFSAGTHHVTGLHGRAECCSRGVTVYLVPGLTTCQRRAVLRRLRQEASRGCGPALPLPQLAIALGVDRMRTAVRIAGAMVRLHPAVTLVPSAFVLAAMTMFVLAAGGRPAELTPGWQVGPAKVAADRGAPAVRPTVEDAGTTWVTATVGDIAAGTGGRGLVSPQP